MSFIHLSPISNTGFFFYCQCYKYLGFNHYCIGSHPMHFSGYSGLLGIYFDNSLPNYDIRKVMPACSMGGNLCLVL